MLIMNPITGNGIEVFRLVRDQEIGGSNPPCPKTAFLIFIIIKALFFVFLYWGSWDVGFPAGRTRLELWWFESALPLHLRYRRIIANSSLYAAVLY